MVLYTLLVAVSADVSWTTKWNVLRFMKVLGLLEDLFCNLELPQEISISWVKYLQRSNIDFYYTYWLEQKYLQ